MFRAAQVHEYAMWLNGFINNGNEVSHHYDYPFERAGFVVATQNFVLKPGYGARSKNILVPRHVQWTGHVGHDNVYMMNGYHHVGSWVPAYSDDIFLMV